MHFIYNIIIHSYSLIISIASLFNNKAKIWKRGRKGIFEKLESTIQKQEKIIWIHCASLGEFEQGRPVMEKIRSKKTESKILLTFFSPSGYEVRKNYDGADYIFYLPLDTLRQAKRFLHIIQPEFVIFVKYEFWYHYIHLLHQKNIPVYCISAIFRKNQIFFTWYGKWYRKILFKFTHIFVQNESSKKLLNLYNIHNVTVAGDTRFDRVFTIAQQSKGIPLIQKFKQNKTTIIAGSSWAQDERLLLPYFNKNNHDLKLIIAPHEIHYENIIRIEKLLEKKSLRFSQANNENCDKADVIIIDNIGMLSSLYKYSTIAYIGGGFGKGIHNILEAATFGQPILFGPNHNKFQEAMDMIAIGAAFPIYDHKDLKSILDSLISNNTYLKDVSEKSRKYIESKLGSTQIIINKILQ